MMAKRENFNFRVYFWNEVIHSPVFVRTELSFTYKLREFFKKKCFMTSVYDIFDIVVIFNIVVRRRLIFLLRDAETKCSTYNIMPAETRGGRAPATGISRCTPHIGLYLYKSLSSSYNSEPATYSQRNAFIHLVLGQVVFVAVSVAYKIRIHSVREEDMNIGNRYSKFLQIYRTLSFFILILLS